MSDYLRLFDVFAEKSKIKKISRPNLSHFQLYILPQSSGRSLKCRFRSWFTLDGHPDHNLRITEVGCNYIQKIAYFQKLMFWWTLKYIDPLTLLRLGYLGFEETGRGSKWPTLVYRRITAEMYEIWSSFLACNFFSTIPIYKPKFTIFRRRRLLHRRKQKNVRAIDDVIPP